ncbi:MAG: M23 family metallopeptidase [Chloroflexi bacterium]|nr:M23 family metallopeptidase [Chloroflexota bacterium]
MQKIDYRGFLFALIVLLAACSRPQTAALVNEQLEEVQIQGTAVPIYTPSLTNTSIPVATAVPSAITPIPTMTGVPTLTPPPPQLNNPLKGTLARFAAENDVPFMRINSDNTGVWRYAPSTFTHPVGLEVAGETAYLIDGGRLLSLDLTSPAPPQTLLAPGDDVAGVKVIEPLDLALEDGNVLVLDRAGDVYRYDTVQEMWQMDRYGRAITETSSHYFVALENEAENRALLETSYNFGLEYVSDVEDRFWLLPEGTRPIDISRVGKRVYLLLQNTATLTATVALYEDRRFVETFQPSIEMSQPRQIGGSETAVYVLDQAGQRLLAFDPQTGNLIQIYQTPDVSAFWVDDAGIRLILTGREQLYFVEMPGEWESILGSSTLSGLQPHDFNTWVAVGPFISPVQGSGLGGRELQMPGAPRHYRLGVHEGIDFYWSAGTFVRTVADGTVIRATHEYVVPDEVTFNQYWERVRELGYTSEEELDFYRGRQVWIEHDDGTIARYVHLSDIEAEVVVGTAVTAGQIIGKIGNSGSPASIKGPDEDAHLHFELWRDGHYLGQFLRPVEIRELATSLFDG